MALKGNLRDFSTTQLLNLISLARKTGTLTIDGREQAQMSFREGKLVYASLGESGSNLAQILQRAGKLEHRGRDHKVSWPLTLDPVNASAAACGTGSPGAHSCSSAVFLCSYCKLSTLLGSGEALRAMTLAP